MPTFSYRLNDTVYTVNLEGIGAGMYRATIGERIYTFRADALENGGWLMLFEGVRALAYTAALKDERYISVNGEVYTLTQHRPGLAGGRTTRREAHRGDLNAQMPGQIREVLVSEGDTVERGQTLMILEAMKMEIRVTTPTDGTVTRLYVETGSTVERGALLAEIE